MKYFFILCCLSIITCFIACDRDDNFNDINTERPAPTIVFSSSDSIQNSQIEKPLETMLNINVLFEAQAGIKNLSVKKDGEQIVDSSYAVSKVGHTYSIDQVLNGEYFKEGDKLDYLFEIEDKNGIVVSETLKITITEALPDDPTFSFKRINIDGDEFISINGNINVDTVLTNDNKYVLNGNVFIDRNTSLDVEEGTYIYAESSAALIVSRGGKLIAKGSKNNPIVFTSLEEYNGSAEKGDWVGIHINGAASVTETAGSLADVIGVYGGSEEGDSSGELEYVRVEYAGANLAGSTGGLNLNGVGSKTVLNYINIYEPDGHGIRESVI